MKGHNLIKNNKNKLSPISQNKYNAQKRDQILPRTNTYSFD